MSNYGDLVHFGLLVRTCVYERGLIWRMWETPRHYSHPDKGVVSAQIMFWNIKSRTSLLISALHFNTAKQTTHSTTCQTTPTTTPAIASTVKASTNIFDTLRQNGRHFADDTFKRIFMNENVIISINISLKFVPKCLINNIPALVQIMAWRLPGDKPLSEPTMVNLLTHICVTRPQWVDRNH